MTAEWLTVPMAATRLDVSTDTVYRHIRNATPEQVLRRKMRLPSGDGKNRMTLVVDLVTLRKFAEPDN
jgi:hypothetical protein